MQSVSFMYTKPPGYNAESARAAELAEEQRRAAQLAIEAAPAASGEGGGGGGGGGEGAVDEALVLAKGGYGACPSLPVSLCEAAQGFLGGPERREKISGALVVTDGGMKHTPEAPIIQLQSRTGQLRVH